MNILFIIGNGFDLNLGLKTSYRDFFGFYTNMEPSEFRSINKLKEDIGDDIDTWSDLEMTLGSYTQNLTSAGDIDEIYFDLLDKLCIHLSNEEKKLKYNNLDRTKFLNDLAQPEKMLVSRDQNTINEFMYPILRNSGQVNIRILTFNYTKTIENIIGQEISDLEIPKIGSRPVKLLGVEHIHGYIDDGPILGLDRIDQIGNEKFRHVQEVIEVLVKPLHNQELGHTRDSFCIQEILKANLICVFGSSIGETDKTWWSKIGERLNHHEQCRMIVFSRGKEMGGRRKILQSRERRRVIDKFLSLTDLNDEQRKKVKGRIFVGVNTDMFKGVNRA